MITENSASTVEREIELEYNMPSLDYVDYMVPRACFAATPS
jgi:hypothetical protein